MKKILTVAAALAIVAAVDAPVRATDDAGGNAAERAAESTGGAIKNGAEATGHAVKRGAEATGHAVKKGAEATGHAIKSGAEATGDALGITDTDRERYEANRLGEHRMTGTVASIDHDTGKVALATHTGTYHLHFLADSLSGVSKGDRLTVTSAFALPDRAAATTGATTEPRREVAGDEPLKGAHWMTGTITDVNKKTGMVDVKTDDMPLKVAFSPEAARDLKPGEKIAVELAFQSAAPAAHSNPSR
jgi:hypothetical protein